LKPRIVPVMKSVPMRHVVGLTMQVTTVSISIRWVVQPMRHNVKSYNRMDVNDGIRIKLGDATK
jgi:hypothetical protein